MVNAEDSARLAAETVEFARKLGWPVIPCSR
jgi:hypothetical protein